MEEKYITVGNAERLAKVCSLLTEATEIIIDIPPDINLESQELDSVRSALESITVSLQIRGMGAVKQVSVEPKMNPYEGIGGYHNAIGGYSCPACHDVGCYQCSSTYMYD